MSRCGSRVGRVRRLTPIGSRCDRYDGRVQSVGSSRAPPPSTSCARSTTSAGWSRRPCASSSTSPPPRPRSPRYARPGVSLDVRDEDRPIQAPADSPFAGKTVVITGTRSVERKEFQALLEAAGAKASGSVSAKTDYVVAGDSAGSRLTKAQSIGVAILTEDEARTMLAA